MAFRQTGKNVEPAAFSSNMIGLKKRRNAQIGSLVVHKTITITCDHNKSSCICQTIVFFRRQSFISLLTKTYRTRSNLVWKNIDDNGGKYELVT